jgi:hypothetical protein
LPGVAAQAFDELTVTVLLPVMQLSAAAEAVPLSASRPMPARALNLSWWVSMALLILCVALSFCRPGGIRGAVGLEQDLCQASKPMIRVEKQGK